jgi:ubiquitin
VYAPIGAGNDPNGLNQNWTQGVSANIQKLIQSTQSQSNQDRVGFIPNEPEEGGSEMTMQQYNNLIAQGRNVKGTPLSNGNILVTSVQPFPPREGTRTTVNPNGSTIIETIALGGDLNKSPTTKLKEGEVLVEDPNSPTGTRIVQVPSEMREKAKNDFSSYVAQVGDSYARLDQLGKAVSAGEFNPLNYVFATEVGQTMARAFGEQGQPLREQINTMAPNIINVIRQSTQMGSKGMDSNAEREFYIKAMGDPKLPIEANIKALDVLDKVYGNGNAVKEMLKNYPELKSKVDKYQLNWSPNQSGKSSTPSIEGAASNQDVYKRHLK